jgi:hypothetical protein
VKFSYRLVERLPENPVVMNMPYDVTFFSTAPALQTSAATKNPKKGSH